MKSQQANLLADGVRIYAVGDIHGCADLLEGVLRRIDEHIGANPIARPTLVFIGDYIDRGPSSRKVLDLLIATAKQRKTVFLKGNHEAFLLDFIRDPNVLKQWGKNGGFETLMSYGLRPTHKSDKHSSANLSSELAAAMPDQHQEFLKNLELSFRCGDYFFAHAGVRPGIPLTAQAETDLLWIREDFLLHDGQFGKVVVHGHTPVHNIDIRPNRINIDTGAYATGLLSCLIIENELVGPL